MKIYLEQLKFLYIVFLTVDHIFRTSQWRTFFATGVSWSRFSPRERRYYFLRMGKILQWIKIIDNHCFITCIKWRYDQTLIKVPFPKSVFVYQEQSNMVCKIYEDEYFDFLTRIRIKHLQLIRAFLGKPCRVWLYIWNSISLLPFLYQSLLIWQGYWKKVKKFLKIDFLLGCWYFFIV